MPESSYVQREPADLDPGVLSDGAVALIGKLLRERPKPAGLGDLPHIVSVISYLIGEVSTDDAQALERRFVRDPAARELLRRVDREVESLRRLDWDDVVLAASARDSGGDSLTADVARIWHQRLKRQMTFSAASLARYLKDSGGWTSAGHDAANRNANEVLAWSTLHAVMHQSLRPSSARSAFATVRGEESPGTENTEINTVGLPAYYRAAIVEIAEITRIGALQVRVGLELAPGRTQAGQVRRQRVRLELTAGGQTWLLDEANVTGDVVEWNISNMAAALAITPGPLDLSRLTLKFGRALRRLTLEDGSSAAVTSAIPETLSANIIGLDERYSWTLPDVTLSMPTAPNFREGRLCLTIGMPAHARFAFAACRLNIDLAVTAERSQRLGSFPVSRWADDGAARVLEIPWPGGGASKASAELALMLLQISLQEGAGSRGRHPEN